MGSTASLVLSASGESSLEETLNYLGQQSYQSIPQQMISKDTVSTIQIYATTYYKDTR